MRIRMSGPGAAHVGMFGRPLIHRNKEDDPAGGGGEGDADEAKFTERFNKLFHKAMGEREKRLETKIMKGLDTTLSSKFEELKTMLAAEKPEVKPDPKPGESKPNELSPETRAMIQRAERDSKDAKEKAEKWEREAKKATEEKAKTEERQQLISSLTGKVKPALLDMVVDQLHGKHLVREKDDDGNPTGRILWKSNEGDLLPFKDGVDSWAKSDFGKEVAPPRDARGSGGRGGSADDAGRNGPMNDETLGSIIMGSIPGVG